MNKSQVRARKTPIKRKPKWLLDILAGKRQQGPCKVCKYNRYEHLVAVRISSEEPNYKKLREYSRQELQEEVDRHTILCTWCFRIHMTKTHKYMDPPPFDPTKPCCGRLCNTQRLYFDQYQLCQPCFAYHTKLKEERYALVNAYKRSFQCCPSCKVDIKPGNEMCFDLDHLDPYQKEHNVSHLIRRLAPMDLIEREMHKCRILCCLCHIDHTKTQRHIFQRRDFKSRRTNLRKHGKLIKDTSFVKWQDSDSSGCDEEPTIRSTYNPLDDPEPSYPKPPIE